MYRGDFVSSYSSSLIYKFDQLYSVGTALGYVDIKILHGGEKEYPKKGRINKVVKNADISTVVHCVQQCLVYSLLVYKMYLCPSLTHAKIKGCLRSVNTYLTGKNF